jgi:addiction module HigA family antidote
MSNLPKVRVPVHPGEMLREEFTRPLGLTQVELARRLGISRRRVNEILAEKRGISTDTALRLARLFGTTPQFWLNLQRDYDLLTARPVRGVTPLARRGA